DLLDRLDPRLEVRHLDRADERERESRHDRRAARCDFALREFAERVRKDCGGVLRAHALLLVVVFAHSPCGYCPSTISIHARTSAARPLFVASRCNARMTFGVSFRAHEVM